MSTHLWFSDDIRNILISAQATSVITAQCAPSTGMLMYLRGYRAALTAVALACGISPEQVTLNTSEDTNLCSPDFDSEPTIETAGQHPLLALELPVRHGGFPGD